MSLRTLVAALGGDLYAGGSRANVPAPGHSASDRSVSLLLSGDRLVVHSFGGADWKVVRDHLRVLGHVDQEGRLLTGSAGRPSGADESRPDRTARLAAARRLWEEAGPVTPSSLSARYLALRAIGADPGRIPALRHHGRAPLSIYGPTRLARPALVASITDPAGGLTAVELTYLAPGGRRDERLRLPRKTIGLVPAGSSVRLAPASPTLVVAEGVISTLSASERLGLPAWALLSAHNLAAWAPPPETRRVVVAADRGVAGEAAARRLRSRLRAMGLACEVAPPPGGAEDWNAHAVSERAKEGR